MSIRIKFNDIFYVLILLWSFFNIFVGFTNFDVVIPFIKYVKFAIECSIKIYCIIKVIYDYGLKKDKKFFLSILLIFIAEFSKYITNNNMLNIYLYFISAMKGINIRNAIKCIFVAKLSIVVVTILSYFSGFIGASDVIGNTGELKRSLGFNHPNVLGILLVEISLILFYLRKNQFASIVLYVLCFLVSYFICYSRTSSYIILFLLFSNLVIFIFKSFKCNAKYKFITFLCYLVMAFSLLISLGIAFKWFNLDDYNSFFSGRIRLYQGFYELFGVKFFGQSINSSSMYLSMHGLSTLDNSYIYLLVSYGLFVFTLYVIGTFITIYRLSKQHMFYELFLFVIYLFYGIFETVAIRFEFNFSLLFIGLMIFNTKCLEPVTNNKVCTNVLMA